MQENNVDVIFDAISENESFARVVAAAFVTRLDPTLEEISDIKTAVSEAVTNSIVHGYEGKGGKVYMTLSLEDREIIIKIMSIKQWSLCIQQSQSLKGQEWAFHLWKHLWTSLMCIQEKMWVQL